MSGVTLPDGALGLAVALGAGLLIGIERERRKGRGRDREAAGLRSFAVAAATGGLAQWVPVPGLVIVGALLVAGLAALSHAKSRSRDPGLTTELALFTTYLIGVQSVLSPALGAACGAGLAVLLAARERLHRFATELLSEQELHDGLLLTALALIVLPLIPARPLDALGGIDPRPLAALVLLILAMQAAGQVALRALGPRGGVLAAGLVSGFVSSTATVASLGGRARERPEQAALLAGGAVLSGVATWLQALLISVLLSPPAAAALLLPALAGAAGALAVGLVSLRTAGVVHAPPAGPPRSALRPREALAVALTLGLVALLVGNAQRHYGDVGLELSVVLAALVDAHAPIASLAALHAAGELPTAALLHGVLLAVSANTVTRCGVAMVAGGRAYALRVGLALTVSLTLAWSVAWW
ncbi:hypothetical protein C1M51_07325 [Methylibium sp. Pch-M]|uniref:MgtC/SapB family protein n=1 Tax=Methylibium sp. Pch-M TaxID=2082386 RepID=UPI0010107FE0|nr:DUF4010 domain-containing protein [Methylibium sp. Pch-M]QAZ39256.1 hypothetical protein C1M51_07325 [Methylibium sp. Pch-M]